MAKNTADFPCSGRVDIPASEFYEIFRRYDKDESEGVGLVNILDKILSIATGKWYTYIHGAYITIAHGGNGYIESGELDDLFKDILISVPRDSAITRELLEQAKQHYLNIADNNYDGKLEPAELAKLLVPKENVLLQFNHLTHIGSVDFMKVWNHYDHDKTGFLEQKELVGFLGDLLGKHDGGVTIQRLDDYTAVMMDLFDVNKDGRIAMFEFEKILPLEDNFLGKCNCDENISEEDFNKIWTHYDQDGNGVIEQAELLAFLRDLWKLNTGGASDPPADYVDSIRQLLCTTHADKVSKGQLAVFLKSM